MRQLPIPQEPKRIAVLNLLAAKLMWEFGEKYRNRVVALPYTIDDQRYSDMVGKWPQKILRISATAEEILLSRPDLVILASFNSIVLRDAIARLQVPHLLLTSFNGFSDYKRNVEKIASTVKAAPQGNLLIQQFESRLEKIQYYAKKNIIPLRLNALGYSYDHFTGYKTSFHDIVRTSGLNNLAAEKGIQGTRKGSIEEILLWNPDVIVIGCRRGWCRKTEERFKKRMQILKNTKVFQKNRIFAIPDSALTSIDENMLEAAEILQKRIKRIP